MNESSTSVDILILGAGWTSTFLIPLCLARSLTYATTTRSGGDSTIKFTFNPEEDDVEAFKVLPDAKTVLITFPLTKPGAAAKLVRAYQRTRQGPYQIQTGFIQLGSSGIWDDKSSCKWYDRHSPFTPSDRSRAEDELLALAPDTPTTVLNLGGLWGGARSMRNWVGRVAPTKEALQNKGSLHMIHGEDVARAVLAVHADFGKAAGQRWVLTDGRVYDWWDLASAWGSGLSGDKGSEEELRGPQARWVREIMQEEGVRALPRDVGALGRALDSREFWVTFGLSPVRARLEG